MKNASALIALIALTWVLALPQAARAQFFEFTRAITQLDTNGTPLAGANTTFADGSAFQPAGNDARSDKWAWRPYGDNGILSSLGPSTSVAPADTKELVTTVMGLKAGTEYEVKVLFWSTDSGFWGVRAGLDYAHGLRTNAWFNNTSAGVLAASYLPWKTMPSKRRPAPILSGRSGAQLAELKRRLKPREAPPASYKGRNF